MYIRGYVCIFEDMYVYSRICMYIRGYVCIFEDMNVYSRI